MLTPRWILDIFAALMLAVATVGAARLVLARQWPRRTADADIAHLLMGIAMAGTLVAGLAAVPSSVWEACFGVLTAWFAWRVRRDARGNGARALAAGHCAPHLVHSASMLYMFLAVTAPVAAADGSGTDGMTGSAMRTLSLPALALVFALTLLGYTVWDIDGLSGGRYALAVAAIVMTRAGSPARSMASPSAERARPGGGRVVRIAGAGGA